MKQILACTLATLLVITGVVFAHSPLTTSTPANGSVVTEWPSDLNFVFKNPVRLTRVTLTSPDGTNAKIDISNFKRFKTHFAMAIPPGNSGEYTVDWRALGSDGHALKGQLHFQFQNF